MLWFAYIVRHSRFKYEFLGIMNYSCKVKLSNAKQEVRYENHESKHFDKHSF